MEIKINAHYIFLGFFAPLSNGKWKKREPSRDLLSQTISTWANGSRSKSLKKLPNSTNKRREKNQKVKGQNGRGKKTNKKTKQKAFKTRAGAFASLTKRWNWWLEKIKTWAHTHTHTDTPFIRNTSCPGVKYNRREHHAKEEEASSLTNQNFIWFSTSFLKHSSRRRGGRISFCCGLVFICSNINEA